MVFKVLFTPNSENGNGDSTKGYGRHFSLFSRLINLFYRLFYASRMHLFRKDNRVSPSEVKEEMIPTKSIMKPIEFEKEKEEVSKMLSKFQFRNVLKIKPKHSQPEVEKVKEDDDDTFRLAAKMITNIVIFHPKDTWKRKEYGGVKMWVNSKTGEVSVDNPYSTTKSKSSRNTSPHKRRSIQVTRSSLRRSIASISTQNFCSSNKELQEMHELLNPKSMLRLTVLDREEESEGSFPV